MNGTFGTLMCSPYTVPEILAQLAGPDRGEVQPPTALTGAPRRSYRLDVEHDAELLYRTVIREASTIDELARYLNVTAGRFLVAGAPTGKPRLLHKAFDEPLRQWFGNAGRIPSPSPRHAR